MSSITHLTCLDGVPYFRRKLTRKMTKACMVIKLCEVIKLAVSRASLISVLSISNTDSLDRLSAFAHCVSFKLVTAANCTAVRRHLIFGEMFSGETNVDSINVSTVGIWRTLRTGSTLLKYVSYKNRK